MIKLKFLNMFWFMEQVGPIQSYLNLKIGLPPVLKAGSSGKLFQLFFGFYFEKKWNFKFGKFIR